ncbi:MAG: PAS domain-containing hybrid sensor histidine kinase/response regulator [Verrucomicrobiaceae bacterium]
MDNFRHLAEALPEIVFTTTPDGIVDYFNTQWGLFGGIRPDDPDFLNWEKRIHPDDLDELTRNWMAAVSTGEVFEEKFRMRAANGDYKWFSTRAVPVRNQTNEIVKWYGVTTNIHEQKEMEIQLRRASDQKDEFIAMLGHELRNPLAALATSFEVLSRDQIANDQHEKAFELLGRQIFHLSRLVDDTLDISRLTSGKLRLITCPLEINRLVIDCCEDNREAAEEKGLVLTTTPYPEELWIDGDDVRLAQCLTNLINNSIKFTDPRGKIEISVTSTDGRIIISVTDSGIGMSTAEINRVFEPFEQGLGARQLSTAGLGLGLAVIQKLTELHQGHVSVQSAGLGKGTTFQISLPKINPPVSAPVKTDSKMKTTKALQILLVEDNESVALSLQMFLELDGHSVQIAKDGDSCLKALEENTPAVLLSDLTLPGHLSGWDIAEKVHGSYPIANRPYLVALSGHTQPHHVDKSIEAGFDEHLAKPPTPKILRSMLARAHEELDRRTDN